MQLLIGTAGICLAVLYFCFLLLFSLKEKKPWWMSDALVANVHCILIISFLAVGVLTLIVGFGKLDQGLIGKREWLGSILIVSATIIGVKFMRISKRMKEHRGQSTGVAVMH